MKNLFQGLLVAASLLIASAFPVKADGIFNPGSSGGGGGLNGFLTCTAGVCTFTGADGSTQMVVGTTNSAVDYLQVLGGVAGAGGSIVGASGTDANVAISFTAKGNGSVNFGNSGSGKLAQAVDPGAAVSANGQVQLTPSTSAQPTKVGNATYGVNLDCGTTNGVCEAGGGLLPTLPAYIVGNWYVPFELYTFSTGGPPGAGSIRFYPVYIRQKMTIGNLGVRVTTLSAGGNIQAAIYATNNATGRPTGTALVSTTSMSTASVANVNATASLQLGPGLYWFATNCDNGTANFSSIGASSMPMDGYFGSATQNVSLQSATGIAGVSVVQTFGTWPDVTSATFTEIVGGGAIPVVQFKIASVP